MKSVPPAAGSLGARVLRQMAVRIALVVCAITFASYWHVYRSATETGIGTLAEYVRERGERESELFLLAQDNLKLLMQTFLAEREAPARDDRDVARAFERAFERNADGATRRRADFDATREPSAYLAARVRVDARSRREMMTMLGLVGEFGRAWHNRFDATFLASLDGFAATYLPGADWYRDIPPDVDFTDYPWVRTVMPDRNPTREPRWTNWYDWVIGRFAVTCILPADIDGRFHYYAGTSLMLDDVIKRARDTGLAGTYNVIFRADGKLVSHPDEQVMSALRANKGEFSIPGSGNAHLEAIYQKVVGSAGERVLPLEAYGEYLGVARIAGPNWYFVSVLPTRILSESARSTAHVVLWLGFASLLLELAIVGWIIRHQVSRPLARVVERLAAFGDGQWSARLEVDRADELGRLSRTFNEMARTLEEEQRRQREHAASLEEKVAERTRQLQEKDRAKTRFLAAASHDLRQPVQAAELFVDNLKQSRLDERQGRAVAYLEQSIRSVRELLDRLLDVSKLDAGAVSPQIATVGVGDLLGSVEAEFGAAALAKGLRIRIRRPRPDVLVRTDPHLVTTILRNLVSNALTYTQRGGVLVGVRRRASHVVLQVWDTGVGIHRDHLERIYEEFYQVENAQRDRSKGFGIGLAIARRAADLLGCELRCFSRPGRGTLFELALPFDRRRAAAPAAPAENAPRAAGALAGLRVAVVENDQLVADSLALWLEEAGSFVSLYASAEEALADESIGDADRYVSDFRLPGAMDGIAFLGAVRDRRGGAIAGVLVTGDTSPEFIERAKRSGWRVLFKPVDPRRLLDALGA